MGKWTDKGFVASDLAVYKEGLETIAIAAFGDDFSLDETTPQGIFIQRLAELFYNADMDGIEAYSRFNMNTASGVYLDAIGQRRGIFRKTGSPQVATVSVTCNPNGFSAFTIPANTQFTVVGNEEQVFLLKNPRTTTTPNFTMALDYSENGNSTIAVGAKLQTTGLSQITDLVVTFLTDGAGTETDMEYRKRIFDTYPVANGTIEYVNGLLRALNIVKSVGCEYNDENETMGDQPPHVTEWLVAPKTGVDMDAFKEEVGTIIINNKVPGSPTFGNTTLEVTDKFGSIKNVSFTIPDKIELEIEVLVKTPETTGFLNMTGVDTIRQKIYDYINSLEVGKDVSYSRCAAPLFADSGFDVESFRIKAKDSEDWVINSNYTIGTRQYASIELADINIGV